MAHWHEDFEDETYPPEMFDEPEYEDDGLYDMEDEPDREFYRDEDGEWQEDEPHDMTDVEADADTLRNCGWGTDEDYGYYGEGDEW
jgi:hypothetical protein